MGHSVDASIGLRLSGKLRTPCVVKEQTYVYYSSTEFENLPLLLLGRVRVKEGRSGARLELTRSGGRRSRMRRAVVEGAPTTEAPEDSLRIRSLNLGH